MDKRLYYDTLAEEIFFKGLPAIDITNFAMYKQGKSFPDVEYAVCQGISSTILRGQGKFRGVIGGMAQNLEEVLEIDTKAFERIYGWPGYGKL